MNLDNDYCKVNAIFLPAEIEYLPNRIEKSDLTKKIRSFSQKFGKTFNNYHLSQGEYDILFISKSSFLREKLKLNEDSVVPLFVKLSRIGSENYWEEMISGIKLPFAYYSNIAPGVFSTTFHSSRFDEMVFSEKTKIRFFFEGNGGLNERATEAEVREYLKKHEDKELFSKELYSRCYHNVFEGTVFKDPNECYYQSILEEETPAVELEESKLFPSISKEMGKREHLLLAVQRLKSEIGTLNGDTKNKFLEKLNTIICQHDDIVNNIKNHELGIYSDEDQLSLTTISELAKLEYDINEVSKKESAPNFKILQGYVDLITADLNNDNSAAILSELYVVLNQFEGKAQYISLMDHTQLQDYLSEKVYSVLKCLSPELLEPATYALNDKFKLSVFSLAKQEVSQILDQNNLNNEDKEDLYNGLYFKSEDNPDPAQFIISSIPIINKIQNFSIKKPAKAKKLLECKSKFPDDVYEQYFYSE